MRVRLRKLWQLDRRQRHQLTLAVCYLAIARLRHALRPVDALLATPAHTEAPTAATADPMPVIAAIETAARHVPWRSDCLIQALAASAWLRRLGLQPRLRLGAARSENGDLCAHAWLELDGKVVLGGTDGAGRRFAPFRDIAGTTGPSQAPCTARDATKTV